MATSPGFVISVTPKGAVSAGDVTVEEKEGVPLEIRGDNADNADKVVVTVEGTPNSEDPYGYIVRVAGYGILDPEVRVVSSQLYMQTTVNEANSLLEEEFGKGLDEVTKIKKDLDAQSEQSK